MMSKATAASSGAIWSEDNDEELHRKESGKATHANNYKQKGEFASESAPPNLKDTSLYDSEGETDPEAEGAAAVTSPSSSRPPKKKIRKAVSWDGLQHNNENARPRFVSISNSNNSCTATRNVKRLDAIGLIDGEEHSSSSSSSSSSTSSTASINEQHLPSQEATAGSYEVGQEDGDSVEFFAPHEMVNSNKDSIFRYDESPPETASTTETTHSSVAGACNSQNRRGRPSSPLYYHHDDDDFTKWEVGQRYQMLRILGRGSYGEVAQARDLHCGGEFVAIKRIPAAFEKEEDSLRIFREMSLLRRLRGHQCIIHLRDVVQPKSFEDFKDLYLVFEFVDTDLYKLIMSPQFLTTEHIQTFLYQLLIGLKYIHSFSIIHRDLKPANILLNEDCSLKICDFGLSRIHHSDNSITLPPLLPSDRNERISSAMHQPTCPEEEPSLLHQPCFRLTRQLTKHVVTRWYRAPELILIQPYTTSVDIWSLGCILAELLSMQEGSVPCYQDRMPLFPGGSCFPLSADAGKHMGRDERLDQLSVIFSVIGTPCEEDVSSIGQAKEYIRSLKKYEGVKFSSIYPAADPAALDLLQRMLQFNPKKRCTAEEALEHEFVKSIRRPELEIKAKEALVGPAFLEAPNIDVSTLKKYTYEEVLHYKLQGLK